MTNKWWQFLFLILPLLAGCATLTTPTVTVVRTVLIAPAINLENTRAVDFEAIGRVSVRNDRQRFSANVHWRHDGVEDTIILMSPLGQAIAEIKRDDVSASLVTSKQETFHARDVEALTIEILGWRLPLDGLQYWVRGENSPLSPASVDLDSEDRIVAIRQDGWEIDYLRYYDDVAKLTAAVVERPRVIQLQFEDLNLRLVIDNWIKF